LFRYRVTLTAEERWELKALTRAATKTTGKPFLYVRALSMCDRAPGGRDGGCLGPNGRAPEEEVPGVNCQERTHEELIRCLAEMLSEVLELNRRNALLAAEDDYIEEKVVVA